MRSVEELGRRAGAEVRGRAHAVGPGDGPAALRARPRRRGRGRALAAVAVTAGTLLAVLPVLRTAIDPGPRIGFSAGPPPAGAEPLPAVVGRTEGGTPGFSAGSGLVLLFDDGYDGVLAMDLDAGVAARRVLEGQRAGDQPWRLTRQGDSLVVGVDRIHAVSIATGESALLGEATIAIPAAEPDRVWLVDYPGRQIGEGPRPHRQVDLSGNVLLETPGLDPETATPAIGIPGGLAYEDGVGVALWDAATGTVRQLGARQGLVADSAGSLLVWCEGDCTALHLTDLDGEDREVPAPDGYTAFEARSARLSPDGSRVAVIVGDGGPVSDEEDGALVVLDVATGEPLPDGTEVSRSARLGWSPDGSELFFASSTDDGTTTLGRYLIDEDRIEFATVPGPASAHDLVVVERSQARAFLPVEPGAEADCRQPGVQPSGRSGICGWRYGDG